MTKTKSLDFEKSLEQLNTIVEQLETGDTTLEKSLGLFEDGVKLTRQCQKALSNAEQKIKILTEQNEDANLNDFTSPDE